jgi:hypothetical protein
VRKKDEKKQPKQLSFTLVAIKERNIDHWRELKRWMELARKAIAQLIFENQQQR